MLGYSGASLQDDGMSRVSTIRECALTIAGPSLPPKGAIEKGVTALTLIDNRLAGR